MDRGSIGTTPERVLPYGVTEHFSTAAGELDVAWSKDSIGFLDPLPAADCAEGPLGGSASTLVAARTPPR